MKLLPQPLWHRAYREMAHKAGACCGPVSVPGHLKEKITRCCETASVGAGLPAKNPTQCMARASPVFAGEPAPTGMEQVFYTAAEPQ
ncbi:protein of unknown function [Pseudomonas sp. JV551A1]|nr:protein of unknown function [Pseudomonas sp. JV551A1]